MSLRQGLLLFLGAVASIMIFARVGLAAGQPNYSGKYSLKAPKSKHDGSSLEVAQTPESIEVTTVDQGNRTTIRYPLDGSKAECSAPQGASGTCTGHFSGKELILEWTAVALSRPDAKPTRTHRVDRWSLSKDARKLTIETHFDFPDLPAMTAGDSSPKVYVRLGNP